MWISVEKKLRWEPGITSIDFYDVRYIEPGISCKKFRGIEQIFKNIEVLKVLNLV